MRILSESSTRTALALVVLLALAGCGKGGNSTASTASRSSTHDPGPGVVDPIGEPGNLRDPRDLRGSARDRAEIPGLVDRRGEIDRYRPLRPEASPASGDVASSAPLPTLATVSPIDLTPRRPDPAAPGGLGAAVRTLDLSIETTPGIPGPIPTGTTVQLTVTASFSAGPPRAVTEAVSWQLTPTGSVTIIPGDPAILSATATGSTAIRARWGGVLSDALLVEVVDTPGTPLTRVNGGGGDLTTTEGDVFEADRDFDGTEPGFTGGASWSNAVPIAGTEDDALYQTLRYAASFGFRAPAPTGAYEIRLHYTEIAPNFGIGSRVFDTVIEGQLVDDDLDVAEVAGTGTALIRTHFIEVVDGLLEIDWSASVNNALICGVEVLSIPQLPAPVIVDLSVAPTALLLDLDGTEALVATAHYNVGPAQNVTDTVTWASSDPAVAALESPAGTVRGVSAGVAEVTATLPGFTASAAITVAELDLPLTVGPSLHTWNPHLGGVVWLPTRAAAIAQAAVFSEYAGDVLVCIKPNEQSFGYRFDLDFWEPGANTYGWFAWDGSDEGEPPTLDQYFQIFGQPNARFILTLPMPKNLSPTPSGGEGFPWQTPEFYGAQCQYLFGDAGPISEWQNLPDTLDFFTAPPGFNWANLRAHRGQVAPYPCDGVLLAGEPYFGEGWDEGNEYGERAELYRQLIRARNVDTPYGVHVHYQAATEDDWFHPMMDELSTDDPPTYFDLFHFYTLPASDDWERSYPVAVKNDGFTFWWVPQSQWASDYTKFLWTFDNVRTALESRGLDPDDFELGMSEHGILLETPFLLNDMTGALHWALWLSEMMRLDAGWDSMWNLVAQGFATAQLQYVSEIVTRTPAFYVYDLAMKLRGLEVLESSLSSPMGTTTSQAVWGNNGPTQFPWFVARAFSDPGTGWRHLFLVNQHESATFTVTGLDGWVIEEWEQLHAPNYTSQNPLGQPGPEPIHSEIIDKAPGDPVSVPPVTVARVVLRPG